MRIPARWRSAGRRLLSEHTEPAQLGVAVGVGVFFACTPFYGFQLWLALGAAWLFRLNKVAAAAGTQFSFPPLIPFIVFASAWVGERVVHGRSLRVSRAQFEGLGTQEILVRLGVAWLVGGAVVGLVAGTTVGLVVALIAARRVRKGLPTEAPAPPCDATGD